MWTPLPCSFRVCSLGVYAICTQIQIFNARIADFHNSFPDAYKLTTGSDDVIACMNDEVIHYVGPPLNANIAWNRDSTAPRVHVSLN